MASSSDDTTKIDLQSLLRFLTRDAGLSLSDAMTRVIPALRKADLASLAAIAGTNLESLRKALGSATTTPSKDSKGGDKDIPKVLHNAAKRVEKKKRKAEGDGEEEQQHTQSSRGKKRRTSPPTAQESGPKLEASLELPWPKSDEGDEEQLRNTVLVTNRAPLVLAFAVQLLKYTMPGQPLSSRLSLAQALVSVNSASKARSLGIAEGKGAEEEGWGQGQPVVKVMGREVKVLKRWGYEWKEEAQESTDDKDGGQLGKGSNNAAELANTEPALWGLDLEALKKSNGPALPNAESSSGLPIYRPEAARAYIAKAFGSVKKDGEGKGSKGAKKEAEEKERNLGLLLKTLDMLFRSWSEHLETAELDRRAWHWYVRTRPEVAQGVAGWGGKGEVKLAEILDLRR